MLFGGWAEAQGWGTFVKAQGWGTFVKAQGKNKNFCLCGKLQRSHRGYLRRRERSRRRRPGKAALSLRIRRSRRGSQVPSK